MTIEGRHSIYDIDSSLIEYMAADWKGRRKICEDYLATETTVTFVGFMILAVLGIVALVKGWI